MNEDRNPDRTKVRFPASAAEYLDLELPTDVVELPLKDAWHRPLRGRIVAVAQILPGVVQVDAEIELQ